MNESSKWVRQAQRGDKDAFARLYGQVYEDLFRYALYTLGRREDAEDAVAETVAAAFREIAALKKAEAFRGWIFRICYNQCRMAMRTRYRETKEALAEQASTGDVAEDTILRVMLSSLSEEERQIVSLHVFGGYKSHEIGKVLGLNASTVRSKERRALRRLREELIR